MKKRVGMLTQMDALQNDALNSNTSSDDVSKNSHEKATLSAAQTLGGSAQASPELLDPSVVGMPTVTMTYPAAVIRRAQRAVFCSPFYHKLLAKMRVSSVSVPTIAEDSGALKGYTQQPLSEVATESELMWLVSVGILRREVDGQGLTDSFRLTPLGRRVVELWQSQGCPDRRASLLDYLKNAVVRWCRVPDWLV